MKRSNSQKVIEKNKIIHNSELSKLAKDLGFVQNNKNSISTRNNSLQKNKYIETKISYRNQTLISKVDPNKKISVKNTCNRTGNQNLTIVNTANLKIKNVNMVEINSSNTEKIRNGTGSLKETIQSNFRSKSLNRGEATNNLKYRPFINKPKILEKNLINNISNINKPKIIKENQPIKNFKVFDQSKLNSEDNILKQNSKIINVKNQSNQKRFDKPSDKISKIKTSDPFAGTKKHKTNFGYVYSAGGIPCRILHGSVKLKLKWDIEPENIEYDPILLVCFEGLLETDHPYNFAAPQCIKEMLVANKAYEKVVLILSKISNPLRMAFLSPDSRIFLDSLDITRLLSELVKESLNPYLHFFLQQINKRAFDIKFKEKVFDLLRVLESNGGCEALKEIKKKIPTYVASF